MDPLISAALASLIGAITTSILMAATYYWGPNRRDRKEQKELDDADNEKENLHETNE